MRVEVFYYEPLHVLLEDVNVSGTDRLTGTELALRKALDSDLDLHTDDEARRCEEVYGLLGNNADDAKPAGFADRTMSVGDLVRFASDPDRVYQAVVLGFRPVSAELLAEHEVDLDTVPAIDFPTWHAQRRA